MDYLGRKMKAQMKSADRLNAKTVLVIGEDEVTENVAHSYEIWKIDHKKKFQQMNYWKT